LVDATESAAELVRLDLARTCDLIAEITVVVEDDWPRVWVKQGPIGGLANPQVDLDDAARSAAEMADSVQEQLMDVGVAKFWPSCPNHNTGLHAEVHDGAAVWWCRTGVHSLGAVGELHLDGGG
jgi:hypothetical protein